LDRIKGIIEFILRDKSILCGVDKDTGELIYCVSLLNSASNFKSKYKLAIEHGAVGVQCNEKSFEINYNLESYGNRNLVWSGSDCRIYFNKAGCFSSQKTLIYFIEDIDILGELRRQEYLSYSMWTWRKWILNAQYVLESYFMYQNKTYFILWSQRKSCYILVVLDEKSEVLQKVELDTRSILELRSEEFDIDKLTDFALHRYSFDDIFTRKIDFLKQSIF